MANIAARKQQADYITVYRRHGYKCTRQLGQNDKTAEGFCRG